MTCLRKLTAAKTIAATLACLVIALVGTVFLVNYWSNTRPAPKPENEPITQEEAKAFQGWAGPTVAQEEFEKLKESFVPFLISGANEEPVASEDKRSALFDASRKVLGKDIPTFRQETGDCVSMGSANACMYLLCVQIAMGDPHEFRPSFPPYIYGTSRVFAGKNRIPCRSAGSVGSWAALAVQQYGTLPSDTKDLPSYSGRLADQWGCSPGPPQRWIDYAKGNLVESAAQVKTWQEVRDALVNGYPVTIASNQGFQMRGSVRDGKLWLSPSGSWAHQMVVIAYDPLPEPCFLILNSWGPTAHGNQPDGPQGSFWVLAKTIQRIVAQGDSFAYSGQKGFPAQQWDVILSAPKEVNRERIRTRDGARDPVANLVGDIAISF